MVDDLAMTASNDPPVYIVGGARTPIGAYLGALTDVSATDLGAVAMRAALERARVPSHAVDEVFMGNVLSAGLGQAPARQAALASHIPDTVPCTTVSKVCGSGLQAVILAARALRLGDAHIAVAGGMESMSRVPYYLQKARGGYRMGHDQLLDGMLLDGLFDPYHHFHMGEAAELCAAKFQLSREAQDAFATESYRRAREAQTSGAFAQELVSVSVAQRKGPALIVAEDEEPGRADLARFSSLRPAFKADGTITAANASSVNDGAAALVLASEAAVAAHGLRPLAKIIGYGAAANDPKWFTTAPSKAIERTLTQFGLEKNSIDLWEINEAFACVTMACTQLQALDPATVNVNGGAVALGHPIGASGTRILVSLLFALQARGLTRGLATLCIGGGEAVALAVERV
jgi:acetyl-CoA C-acetyltransferase